MATRFSEQRSRLIFVEGLPQNVRNNLRTYWVVKPIASLCLLAQYVDTLIQLDSNTLSSFTTTECSKQHEAGWTQQSSTSARTKRFLRTERQSTRHTDPSNELSGVRNEKRWKDFPGKRSWNSTFSCPKGSHCREFLARDLAKKKCFFIVNVEELTATREANRWNRPTTQFKS